MARPASAATASRDYERQSEPSAGKPGRVRPRHWFDRPGGEPIGRQLYARLLGAQRGNYNQGGQTLQVLVDGPAVGGNITPTDANYATYSTAAFTVTAGTHTITIEGTNPLGGDNTALVDNVSVQAAVSATQLADPDFSAVSVAAGAWQYAPSGSPWTFTGTAGVSGN